MAELLQHCGDCAHGEAHGFSKHAEEHGYPVTIYFWCPVGEHHDPAHEPCEHYIEGENRRVYDDVDGGF